MNNMIDMLSETISYFHKLNISKPGVGIVLGSGLGNFKDELDIEVEVDYDQIPHFPVATVEGHHGKLIFGKLNGVQVVAMAGRFHFYEGYTAQEVVYPIRVMKQLGIEALLLTNAAGGVKPGMKVGDLMIIHDHISLGIINPLIGKNIDSLGGRFPDMSEPYKRDFIEKAKNIAVSLGLPVSEGVYFGVTGPTFETRAEYKMIQVLGGDAVGMSTVQEVIAANHMGLPVFALSVITDLGIRDEENIITHEEVLLAAKEAEPKVSALIREMVKVV
ncbi:MAG: purine-nucleoside phosphorylase [Chitinophagaceae bacterium]|nr:purine-nucleoside phosphorylase [Chitinophagaceae bacterium]